MKIIAAVILNTLKTLRHCSQNKKVYFKFTSFRYSYVLTHAKKKW